VGIAHPRLWEPGAPQLYQVTAAALIGHREAAGWSTQIGIRSIRVSRQGRLLINGLPATLRETRRSLDALRVLSDRSRPLLPELNAAAGPLATLLGEVPAFSAAARPALRHLAAAARTGTATLRDSGPVVKRLRRFARLAVPVGRLTAALNESLRATGTPEEIETFVYNAALALARFDQSSHILPSFVVGLGDCAAYASTTSPACDAHYAKGGDTSARGRRVLDFLLG